VPPSELEQLFQYLQPGRAPPTHEEVTRFMAKVQNRARWIPGCSAKELLQEAIVASLPGSQHPLNPDVDVLAHLHTVVHHIARDSLRRQAPHRLANSPPLPPDPKLPTPKAEPRPDDACDAQEKYAHILSLLEKKDEEAWWILQRRHEGARSKEIQEELSLSPTAFESKLKKIRRLYNSEFPARLKD